MVKPILTSNAVEFGRVLPNISSMSLEKVFPISQAILDSVLPGNKSRYIRGIHAVMKIKRMECVLVDTLAYEYSLVFADKPSMPVASIRTEESTAKNDSTRTKLFAISVIDISRLKEV